MSKKTERPKSGFVNNGILRIWGQVKFYCEGCHLHCWAAPLSSTCKVTVACSPHPEKMWQPKCLRTFSNVLWGKISRLCTTHLNKERGTPSGSEGSMLLKCSLLLNWTSFNAIPSQIHSVCWFSKLHGKSRYFKRSNQNWRITTKLQLRYLISKLN